VETQLSATVAKEMAFYSLFAGIEEEYDVVLFDVAPSISHVQSACMAYAQNVLIPVAMDTLSVEGAKSSLSSIAVLNQFFSVNTRCIGFLPTQVDNRLRMTGIVLNTLKVMAQQADTRVLHEIHQDQAVNHAMRHKRFLHDYDTRSKALADYRAACAEILESLAPEERHAAIEAASPAR
jgi:chromosome partitioning protein